MSFRDTVVWKCVCGKKVEMESFVQQGSHEEYPTDMLPRAIALEVDNLTCHCACGRRYRMHADVPDELDVIPILIEEPSEGESE